MKAREYLNSSKFLVFCKKESCSGEKMLYRVKFAK